MDLLEYNYKQKMAPDVRSRSKWLPERKPKQGANSSKRAVVADSARLLTPAKMEYEQQRKYGPKEVEQGGETEEEEEVESSTPTTVIDLRRSLGIAAADMHAVLEHRELVMERRLSLPEEHPRSNSNEEGHTDQEESDLGARSDRSDSIE